MQKKYKLSIVIGRFQPIHKGHECLIQAAIDSAENTLVIVGSVNKPRTPKNPFTFEERRSLIQKLFKSKLEFCGIEDNTYNDDQWFMELRSIIKKYISFLGVSQQDVCIVGFIKDSSSYYLKNIFSDFESIKIEPLKVRGKLLNATVIRQKYFQDLERKTLFSESLNTKTVDWLEDFSMRNSKDYLNLQLQEKYYNNYTNEASKFPSIYQTVDAIVVKNGKILLIQRKHNPGQGLYALPGGFVNINETLEQSCLRELKEETKINISYDVLKTLIRRRHTFDNPLRSERGRVITTAFYINLDLYKADISIFPDDDACGAGWFDLDEIVNLQDKFFEDHLDIVKYFIK